MKTHNRFADDFLSLFYPRLCLACGHTMPPEKEAICISCQYHLPKSNFHMHKNNPFMDTFEGRVRIENGAALYLFNKGGRTQKLIHQLKYKGKSQIGVRLGKLYGKLLKESPHFKNIDLILPVPLHPRKAHTRGYNQSDVFAQGLSESMAISWKKNVLIRTENSTTQTQKSRLERLQNVQAAFEVAKPKSLVGKHILLVDDVLTTGATLETIAEKILDLPGTKVSLATIAYAK